MARLRESQSRCYVDCICADVRAMPTPNAPACYVKASSAAMRRSIPYLVVDAASFAARGRRRCTITLLRCGNRGRPGPGLPAGVRKSSILRCSVSLAPQAFPEPPWLTSAPAEMPWL